MFDKLIKVLGLLEVFIPNYRTETSCIKSPQFVRRLPNYTDSSGNDPINIVRFRIAPKWCNGEIIVNNSIEIGDFLQDVTPLAIVERMITQTSESDKHQRNVLEALLIDKKFMELYVRFKNKPCLCICGDSGLIRECNCDCHRR